MLILSPRGHFKRIRLNILLTYSCCYWIRAQHRASKDCQARIGPQQRGRSCEHGALREVRSICCTSPPRYRHHRSSSHFCLGWRRCFILRPCTEETSRPVPHSRIRQWTNRCSQHDGRPKRIFCLAKDMVLILHTREQ